MSRRKDNQLIRPVTAITQSQTKENERLAGIFIERVRKSQTVPFFKDKALMMRGHENDHETGETLALAGLMELCKTDHCNVALDVIERISSVSVSDDPDKCLNSALRQLSALEPQCYLETMLIGQMLQVNAAASKCMITAFTCGQHTTAKELNANLAIKFQRTFVAQIEALQKLRGKGGQKVTVEHVHVHKGGQAIVGNVNHTPVGGRGNDGK